MAAFSNICATDNNQKSMIPLQRSRSHGNELRRTKFSAWRVAKRARPPQSKRSWQRQTLPAETDLT